MSVYRLIAAERAEHGVPVSRACELLEVSRSGYQKWLTRPPSDRALSDAWLTEQIKQIHSENRKVYGAPEDPRRAEDDLRHPGRTRAR